jgi:hypothetical protein
MTKMLELSDEDFIVAIIKNAAMSNYEHIWNKWKNRNSWRNKSCQQRNKTMEILEIKNAIIEI